MRMDKIGSATRLAGLLTTPSVRFLVPASLMVAVVLALALGALQPASGWTWDARSWRSPLDAGASVWVPLGVGLGASTVSAWVWALKPKDPPAILFAISGLMTLLFTGAAVIWDFALALPPPAQIAAVRINTLGASGFGIVMISLFLIYPRRLPGWRWLAATALAGFGGATLFALYGPGQNFALVHPITFWEMVVIVGLVIWQIFANRGDPPQRAVALWLGASVLLGAGGFIATVAFPYTFGLAPLLPSNIAFAFFLLIYAGLAVGLLRFRVFGLGGWAFQLLFHFFAALGVLSLDLLLVSVLSFDAGAAFSIAILLAAAVYLPARSLAWRFLTGRKRVDETKLFKAVIDITLRPSGEERAARWGALLRTVFRPLEMAKASEPFGGVAVLDEGAAMGLPAMAGAPSLVLRYRDGGRGLFSPRDLTLAGEMVKLIAFAEESRTAYDRGVSEERARIARDIHDNIGAQLLRALHSRETGRKDEMIRETLTDIRDVINNAQGAEAATEDILADLRAETADRLEPHGIGLSWNLVAAPGATLSQQKVYALRALVREAVSNTIKHADAQRMDVTIALDTAWLNLNIRDDGRGLPAQTDSLGNGLINMKIRVESFGGEIVVAGGQGTLLTARIPAGEVETVSGDRS